MMKAVVKTEAGYDHMQYMDIPEPKGDGRSGQNQAGRIPASAEPIYMPLKALMQAPNRQWFQGMSFPVLSPQSALMSKTSRSATA